MRGKLIVLDGSDGVGKATQTKLLFERLETDGHEVRTLSFPRYRENFFGTFVRELLDGHHGSFVGTDPYLASLPYAADRFESKEILEGWLKEGAVVVLDRYVSANQMHQGGKIRETEERRRFLEWLDTMEHEIFKIPRPDLILYLHLPVEISISLMDKRSVRDQHESDPRHLSDAQNSAFDLIRSRGNWHRIDCEKDGSILPRDVIHDLVYTQVLKVLS